MPLPNLLILASGTSEGGGSGFKNLVNAAMCPDPVLKAQIVAVASNHPNGGVSKIAHELGVPFFWFARQPLSERRYINLAFDTGAEYVALSGWNLFAAGLNPIKTFNIHPGPTHLTKGLYGIDVHRRMIELYRTDPAQYSHTSVDMHFVTDQYDSGPVFFRFKLPIRPHYTAETLANRVNGWEHFWQPRITNLVVQGKITWDGRDPNSLEWPSWYHARYEYHSHLKCLEEWQY